MDIHHPLLLLGGLSPAQFMRRHWQKKPLLVRGAIVNFKPLLSRQELVKLASRESVGSRLIVKSGSGWHMKNGPTAPRRLPPMSRPDWTLLVQSVDAHHDGIHQLLQKFRFVPDARLDDLMISLASTGGGVGPHFDSYDVFLLQASGRRTWQIGRQKNLALQSGVPLKILQHFEPEEEFVLEAGDMLYLPPRYAHNGTAVATSGANGKSVDCMTYSIGFKAPSQSQLAAQLLAKLAEITEDEEHAPQHQPKLYSDRSQKATATPAELPGSLLAFADAALTRALGEPHALACAVGEILTMPQATIWFDEPQTTWATHAAQGMALDIKTRMMYDAHHIFINGESYLAKGEDASLMHLLANDRSLSHQSLTKCSAGAAALLADWHAAGWVHFV